MEKTEDLILPSLRLPVQPPIEPMLAQLTRDMPSGPGWLYEPNWDGFRSRALGTCALHLSRNLVCEVAFNHWQGEIPHGGSPEPIELEEIFGLTQHEGSQV